ncbi:iron-containing redox enzyme family protein [Hahella aquimaris]|uniref:iron-containing redox enzyme family protein n=1 Tax=Hahella sp. HNIBRBA332 TaxID=3015983 RepID=UPI00273B0B42|nr:iron-containing redox enzyme family protein [Hahella sp. HNIBRBA332]WLQ14967.1 iron-containing redox enzyme family protein [Hahella sp. HNIBRBA332]
MTEQTLYEVVDQGKMDALRKRHAWLVEPIYRASDHITRLPFFTWVRNLNDARQFKPVAEQLYYHSATFPKVLGLMLGMTSLRNNPMMPFYAKHAFGEADHHMLLRDWMLQHGLIRHASELDNVITSLYTNACVNMAYQLAIEQDQEKWLVAINSGIERCSNDFFKVVAPKMYELNAGHCYFDIHVEADEHHSIMGLEYLTSFPENSDIADSHRAKVLLRKALEGVSLWGAMLHSWIGVDYLPRFDDEGELINPPGSQFRLQ